MMLVIRRWRMRLTSLFFASRLLSQTYCVDRATPLQYSGQNTPYSIVYAIQSWTTRRTLRHNISYATEVYGRAMAFRNPTLAQTHSREVWQWPRLESLFADLKLALRRSRRSPGLAARSTPSASLRCHSFFWRQQCLQVFCLLHVLPRLIQWMR
jgi:hypothetical protein